MTDEKYVQAHFPDSHELEGRYGTSLVWLDKDAVFGDWAAAAEFTRERLQQIRQLDEDIVELMAMDSNARKHVVNRIIVLLESALADLRKGMKA